MKMINFDKWHQYIYVPVLVLIINKDNLDMWNIYHFFLAALLYISWI